MKASDLFVKCLEAEGVSRIYGVPGEENADLLRSLSQSNIEFVITRHEQAAAFMAAAEGKLTGRPGVCLGTLGPGATNLVTGVADGNMDRAPLLVITGQGALTRQHKESHQIMNVVEMFRPITKWSHAVLDPRNIPEIIRKAFKLAAAEKPGAAHIELAEDVATMQVDAAVLSPQKVRRAVPDDKIIDQAWAHLKKAKSPLIIAGNGAIRTRASRQLRDFCDGTGIGVLMTFMAKGAVDRNAPYCLFTIGMGQKDIPLAAIDAADLIMTVGYDMVEYPPSNWNVRGDKTLIHLDFLPAEVDADYVPDVEIVGDLAHGLWMLNQRVRADTTPSYDFEAQHDVRSAMMGEFSEHAEDHAIGAIKPQKAVYDARRALGENDLLFSGVGAHKMWIARYYQADEPGTCFISNGFCSMGMALPAAIGASQADPSRRILAIASDGDFLMNVQDMETAKRLKTDLTVLVWEDHAYGLIEWKQKQEFGEHTDLSFTNPDWVKLAESFGWTAERCEASVELYERLRSALNTPGPSLLVIPIDYSENMKLTRRLGEITCRL